LGGDFYDFLPYGKGRLACVLGDVSGKGTAAALYGSLAIGTVREIVVEHASEPACMLETLNRRLLGARLDARFIAMLFAVYDASRQQITLANAGGPYPLLVRNGKVETIHLEGVPLGLIAGTEYDETTIDVRPGDIILFASDGILESENAAQEEFGPDRLMALLSSIPEEDSAQDIADKVLAATDGHSGRGTAPHDDRTLIVLRIREASSSDYSKMPIIY
jgi:sigma-B regulation protein RsbU (phosphoserine phosphatase)